MATKGAEYKAATQRRHRAMADARNYAILVRGHHMSADWTSVPERTGDGAAWFCKCLDCGAAVSVESTTLEKGGRAYAERCGGPA